ncbi:MAG: hypothetical protein CMP24_04230 [Rickettsiales bacterium]|nr:hypothetical protein [Rickettsiales bacterium]
MIKKNIQLPFWHKNKKIKNLFDIFGHHNLMFVGGAVRCALTNEKTYDLDLAISLTPSKTKKILKKNNINFFDISSGHGTITLQIEKFKIEITSLRIDKISFGRRAKVEFTDDFYSDSCRRDFSINAIYSNFNGKIYDPHKGLNALNKKTVKFIGNPLERITEDNLRILRYFRFVATYNDKKKQLDKNSLESCINNINLINKISKERIYLEFAKLIVTRNAGFVLSLMKKMKVLDILVNGLSKISFINLRRIDKLEKDIILRICFLFLKSKIDKESLARDLRMSNKDIKIILSVCEDLKPIKGTEQAKKIKYFYGSDIAKKKYQLQLSIFDLKKRKNILEVLDVWKIPVLPVNGNDIKLLKNVTGRKIGKYFRILEIWWIHKKFKPTRKQCLYKLNKINI